MRILIVGGTRFVGLAIAREAIARGHEVELFHRSAEIPPGTEGAKHLLGDRNRDFTSLQEGTWDAVIDVCGYRPHEIHALYDVFAGRIGKYVFVSTISVYDGGIPDGSDESAQQADTSFLAALDPITVEMGARTYGPLKVLCEEAVREHYADHLIIRPTFVIGEDDYTDRFTRWVKRIAEGGVVDAPEPKDGRIQYIDARDLAAFTLKALEDDRRGAFHVAAPSGGTTFAELLETIREVVGPEAARLNWVSVEEANERPADFPLWAGGKPTGMRALDTSAAEAAGLTARPLSDSVRDLLRV